MSRMSKLLLTSAAMCPVDQVTTEEDLEIIFSRFGNITSCDIIRDYKTGGCTVCMQPHSLPKLRRHRSRCTEFLQCSASFVFWICTPVGRVCTILHPLLCRRQPVLCVHWF